MNNHKNNSGFTLIEIMVTIAIVGIFASIALPSFSKLIESNRITTATNELVSNLLFTRSEALKRSSSVTLCPSSNQTSCSASTEYSDGWIIFLDCDGDDTVGETIADCGPNGTEDIIKVHDSIDSLFMTNNVLNKITFTFTGRPAGVSTFSIRTKSAPTINRSQVVVSLVGRIRAE